MTVRTYVVDESRLGHDESQALYRALLTWSARRGDRAIVRLAPDVYDDESRVERLRSLGETRTVEVSGIPDDFVGRALSAVARVFGSDEAALEVEAAPDEALVRELTADPPTRATGGEVAPVEDVSILDGERRLYGSYDYGARQVLELEDEELEDLRRRLGEQGLDEARIREFTKPEAES